MKIGFIGAGKVASALGKYFVNKGVNVVGYYSRHIDSSAWAASYTNSQAFVSMEELVRRCDIVFLAVPDSIIPSVWLQLCQFSLKDKYICHFSGALSSAVFTDIQIHQAYGYAVHPLYAFHAKEMDTAAFHHIHFTIEGDNKQLQQLYAFFTSLSNPVAMIPMDKKAQYHAACVMVSNLVIGLVNAAQSLLQECGLDKQFTDQAWHSLFLNNAHNMCEFGCKEALTGPLERGDILTIKQHLACLQGKEKKIYIDLSLALLTLVKEKHPTRDYQLIEQELINEK